jgi:hypothetical protein
MHRHSRAQRRAAAAATAAGAEQCASSSALGQQGWQAEQGLQRSGGSRRRRGPEALHALSVAQPERSEASSAGAGHEDGDSVAAQQERVGVLLLNLGGPETLEDVQPFLYNLFADDSIIRLPPYGAAPLTLLLPQIADCASVAQRACVRGVLVPCDCIEWQSRQSLLCCCWGCACLCFLWRVAFMCGPCSMLP